MNKLIDYFTKNVRLNYVLLVFIMYLGITSYMDTPREIFPEINLEKITINGGYSGTSAKTMDQMVVKDIENDLSSIGGIDKYETIVTPGEFSILITLNESANKVIVLNKVKDVISRNKQYLPSDMIEPIANLVDKITPVIDVSMSSNKLSRSDLIDLSKEIEGKVSKIRGVSKVNIRGDAEKELSIEIDSNSILAYRLDPTKVISAISNLSYIFPIGDIEEKNNFLFVSTANGEKTINQWEKSLIKIDNKYLRLKDISTIKERYPDAKTISSFNQKNSITFSIMKSSNADSMNISSKVRSVFNRLKVKYPEVTFNFFKDSSKKIENRLNIVISNLMFGLILVFFSMYILINLRIAIVVVLGIPFSFLIGITFLHLMGYSINIISLLGALLVIGIVVDDAIVIAENIQRHIDDGIDRHKAALMGVKEMILPISLATLTTMVAFLPIFTMTGEIKMFIILIPIMTITILIGSLIESFLFLPLHSAEILRKSNNMFDWTYLQNKYKDLLNFLIKWKKTFLTGFLIIIPILTLLTIKSMNFQFFAPFDGTNIYISAKLNINNSIEETNYIGLRLEHEFQKRKKEYFIKNTSLITGYRQNLSGEEEISDNVFLLTVELEDPVDSNFFDKYINNILNFSFDFNNPSKVRTVSSAVLANKARELIKNSGINFEEIEIREDKAGLVKGDININIITEDNDLGDLYVKKITKALKNNKAVTVSGNNISFGKKEYKLGINKYGESIGITEATIGKALSGFFLDKKQATRFSKEGVMEIKTLEMNKDDLSTLMNFEINLNNGSFEKISKIVDIRVINDYEKLEKLNGENIKSVFANINQLKTATQVLEDINPIIEEAKNKGLKIVYQGEKEKKDQLIKDMKKAGVIAVFLIFISLLLIFSKIKYVLMVISVIPMSLLGSLVGHKLLGMNLSMPSIIGILGLAGVVINDAIIMLDFLKGTRNLEEFLIRAKLRLRPILITSITTFFGMFTLIFYASGETIILQPIAVSIGFGLLWGTVLNLLYIPVLYAVTNQISEKKNV